MIFENPIPLLSFYANHIFSDKINIFIFTAILIFAFHSLCILMITKTFSTFMNKAAGAWRIRFSFVIYTLVMLLIMSTHLFDLLYFSYVLDSMKVFPDPMTAFFFTGEMYTTVGYGSYHLPDGLRGLPVVIAFTGLFSASISGAGLYSMLQNLGKPLKNH